MGAPLVSGFGWLRHGLLSPSGGEKYRSNSKSDEVKKAARGGQNLSLSAEHRRDSRVLQADRGNERYLNPNVASGAVCRRGILSDLIDRERRSTRETESSPRHR